MTIKDLLKSISEIDDNFIIHASTQFLPISIKASRVRKKFIQNKRYKTKRYGLRLYR